MSDALLPTVAVLIPCLNERTWIEACLDSLACCDYPADRIQFVVIDGGSDDGTLDIVERVAQQRANVVVLHNAARLKPHGLNLGIARTDSEVVIRVDAHASYPDDYVRCLVEDLQTYEADNTGGVRETYVGGDRMAQAIGLAISHRFAAGDAHYRTGAARVRVVDSVFGGCYRREVFTRIGGFNEHLIRTQDREFNRRLIAAGGKIVLDPAVRCLYYPRTEAAQYWRWNYDGAFWLFYARRFTAVPMVSWRNLVPMSLVLWHAVAAGVLLGTGLPALVPLGPLLAYWLVNLSVSLRVATKRGDILLGPAIALVFAMTHFGYGLASLHGWVRALIDGKVRE